MRLRACLAAPVLKLAQWRAPLPERLLIAPQDVRTGDPTLASDIYAGYFTFAGKVAQTQGRSPFVIMPPSEEWARKLYGFSWLRHLRAAETALARANARALVKEFIFAHSRRSAHIAWAPDVVARRALSWLSQSPMLLEGVDYDDYRAFIATLAEGDALLRRCAADRTRGEIRLNAAIAMSYFALCAQGPAAQLNSATKALAAQLRAQILPDGGPIARNPQRLVDLLLDLLPLRQAFSARGLQPPQELLNAIDRMTPALRMFRHGDGALALFNGMGVTAPERVATLLGYQGGPAAALANAPHSGFQRLEAGDALVIADFGAAPPPVFSRAAHAGCLSFEFSHGVERLVVNCGAPGLTRRDLRDSARVTAAHSTLTLADNSSCLFAGDKGVERFFAGEIVAGPSPMTATREARGDEIAVSAAHDGYLRRFGLIHRRRLALRADGGLLRGRDQLVSPDKAPPGDLNYALRFHIHPSVAVAALWEGQGALLRTAGGADFTFEAGGLPVAIEESIFFAAPEGPRPCAQLVVYGDAADIAQVDWSFARQNGAA